LAPNVNRSQLSPRVVWDFLPRPLANFSLEGLNRRGPAEFISIPSVPMLDTKEVDL